MNNDESWLQDTTPKTRFKIIQQNLNKLLIAQLDFLHSINDTKANIIILQEPYIDHLKNTRALLEWYMLYPTTHYKNPKETRTIMLINKKIPTDNWNQLHVGTGDAVAISIDYEEGHIDVYNVYNDCKIIQTIPKVTECMDIRRRLTHMNHPHHIILAGDFNQHHPLWDEDKNHHLFMNQNLNKAQEILDCITLMRSTGMNRKKTNTKPTQTNCLESTV